MYTIIRNCDDNFERIIMYFENDDVGNDVFYDDMKKETVV